MYQNNNLYQSNLLRLLTQTDYNTLNSSISSLQSTVNSINNKLGTTWTVSKVSRRIIIPNSSYRYDDDYITATINNIYTLPKIQNYQIIGFYSSRFYNVNGGYPSIQYIIGGVPLKPTRLIV